MQFIFSYLAIAIVRLLGLLPLSILRALGYGLGNILYYAIAQRRRIANINISLCLPHLSPKEVREMVKAHFVCFIQAVLDRGWLWYAPEKVLRQRLQFIDTTGLLETPHPLVLFLPHFVGLDAASFALGIKSNRKVLTIYTNQSNEIINNWILKRRARLGNVQLFARVDGVKDIVSALRKNAMLALLADMDFGEKDAFYVPFFNTPAATLPSLSRFAKLGKAKVVPIICKMTPKGYEVTALPAWENYPSDHVINDTARMNKELETYIHQIPEQYYWVHKRFKHRPKGEAAIY